MNKNCKELQGVVREAPIIILEEVGRRPPSADLAPYIEYLPVEPPKPVAPPMVPIIARKTVKVVVTGGQLLGMAIIVALEMLYTIFLLLVELLRMCRRPKSSGVDKIAPRGSQAPERQKLNVEVTVKIN